MRGHDPVILQKFTEEYPQFPRLSKGEIWNDEFNREALNTTGAISLYTSATGIAGTATIANNNALRIAVTAALGDDCSVRTSGFKFQRVSDKLDPRTVIEVDYIMNPADIVDMEFFGGLLLDGGAAITALPTTTRHMGLRLDISASGNYFTTSSDGTTQTTEDTGVAAVVSTNIRCNIVWDGVNSATIKLFTGSTFDTLSFTDTVTAIDQSVTTRSYGMNFYVENEAALDAKSVDIREWGFQVR